jgi:hypothetical protein
LLHAELRNSCGKTLRTRWRTNKHEILRDRFENRFSISRNEKLGKAHLSFTFNNGETLPKHYINID